MAKTATLELLPAEQPGTDIVVAVTQNPGIVLLDEAKRDQFYDRLKAETDKHVADLTTDKGRKEVASLAYKVTRSKTAIDTAAKALTEGWRNQTAQVNAARKEITTKLDELAADIRRPLTDWESAEQARVTECQAVIDGMKAAAIVAMEDTADTVRARGQGVHSTPLDVDRFGDMMHEAMAVKESSVAILVAALKRLTKEEADRAELEQLRAQAAERAAREQAEQEAREQAEREAEAARVAEQRCADAAKAEALRIETAQREAAAAAQMAAERAAQVERDRVQREHDAALAAERKRAADAEAAAQAERDRVAREEAARAAEAKRIADEQAAREANRAHVSTVMREAKEAIMTCGVSEEVAKAIVVAIKGNLIPRVSLAF